MSRKSVSEVMSRNVVSIREHDTLAKAFKLLDENRISGAPVKNRWGQSVGVLSKTDLVSEQLSMEIQQGKTLEQLNVKDFMNPITPLSIHEDDSVEQAIEIMSYRQVHRLFVVNDYGQMVGVISTFDIVKLMSQVFMAYL